MSQISQLNGNTLVDTVARQTLAGKQDQLVSGTSLKTVNGTSLLGSGNVIAGLVDDIRVNGTTIVTNKIANFVIKNTLNEDGNDLATVTAIREFVNSSINALASYYITADADGNAFASKAALDAGPYYYAGTTRSVTKNDYAIVMTDETHGNKSARYVYTDNQWAFQYTFQMSFTQSQLNAINSGITSAAVTLYNNHLANTSNPHSVTKSQVGLGNVANERQYSSANPPPYPVTSVAGKTGAVTLGKSDVGLGNVGNFKAVSTSASQGLSDTEKTNARTNIGAYAKPSTGIPASDLADGVLSGKQNTLDAGTGITIDDYDEIRVDGNSVPVKSSWTTGAVPKKNANTGAWDEIILADVATTGSYSDLKNTPSIPIELSAGAGIDSYGVSEQAVIRVDDSTVPYRASWSNGVIPKKTNNGWGEVTLATVATSGSYNDLSNKPSIPAAQIQSDWNQTDTTKKDYIKNKPTIPNTVNYTLSPLSDGTYNLILTIS